jgi:hypothetical protein
MSAMPQDPAMLEAELRARIAHAQGPYDEAVWRLAVGDAEASLDAIRAALPQLAPLAPGAIQVAQLALVAGDLQAARAAAEAALHDAVGRYVPGNREYQAAILSLIARDEAQAAMEAAALDAFVATHPSFRGGQPAAVAGIPRGLVARDGSALAAGLDALLGWHLRRARARSDVFNSSRGVVALDAVVAMILGWQRGLRVDVAGTYRAARVPLLALHLTEWDGRPLPRGLPLEHVTDLVAGPWLRASGVPIEDPVPPRATSAAPSGRRAAAAKTVSSGEEAHAAREAIARRRAQGGSAWQLASWALMLDDVDGARDDLMAKAADARRAWEASLPAPGGGLRWFRKDQALPNQNLIREHFGLALALHDEEGMRDTTAHLRAWLSTQEDRVPSVYGHASGYLDLICDVLSGERSRLARPAIDQVMGPYSSTRVAAIALVVRDPAGLRQGLEGMLEEHAKQLERKSSPPSPICAAALQIAAAADRLGMEVVVDDRYGTWPVPVEGGRVPCDLLGRAIWADRG